MDYSCEIYQPLLHIDMLSYPNSILIASSALPFSFLFPCSHLLFLLKPIMVVSILLLP